jgi:hypothetical protein
MRKSVAALGFAVGAVMAAACHTNQATGVLHMCKTDVSSITSPAPGVITLKGNFYADESVIVHAGSVSVGTGTPATDRTSFSFVNVPSGTQSIDVIVSCDGGEDHIGATTVVVQ